MPNNVDLIDRRALNTLPVKERLFVLEWLLDQNQTQAAIRAGYSEKRASITASELMKKPRVYRAIQRCIAKIDEKVELTLEMALKNVIATCERTSDEFLDPETGRVHTDLRKLGPNVKQSVDSVKQVVKQYTDEDGNVVSEVITTEIRCMPKATGTDMALKIKGAYAPDKQEVKVVHFDFDKFYNPPPTPVDPVMAKLEEQQLAKSLINDVIEEDPQDGETSTAETVAEAAEDT